MTARVRGIVFAVLCTASTVLGLTLRADAATLYGATASGSPGTLYTIDQASSLPISTIGLLNDAGGTNYPVTGLAFHPTTGVLYGSTGNNPAATAGTLVAIDPATALVTVVGPYNAGPTNTAGTPATMADLAFDSAGNLYGVASIGGPDLYSINTATGQATLVGANGVSTSTTGGGLAISAADDFYGTPTASRFGTYDSTTGVFTDITNPVKPGGGGAYSALAFDPDTGLLYGLNSAPGSPPPTYLALIDPATGAVTAIGQSVFALDAIAFQPTVGDDDDDSSIPSPAPAALAAVGLGLLTLRRQRAGSRD